MNSPELAVRSIDLLGGMDWTLVGLWGRFIGYLLVLLGLVVLLYFEIRIICQWGSKNSQGYRKDKTELSYRRPTAPVARERNNRMTSDSELQSGAAVSSSDVVRRRRWFTCHRHGWDALGRPCPECRDGDAPRHCAKHGWSHMTKGCPQCSGQDA